MVTDLQFFAIDLIRKIKINYLASIIYSYAQQLDTTYHVQLFIVIQSIFESFVLLVGSPDIFQWGERAFNV